MPTYVYECNACGNTFEAEQRITEPPLTNCACGSSGTVKRLIQPIAVMFKGSGFHINDYAPSTGAPKAESAAAEGKEAPPVAVASEPAAESKPAADAAVPAKSE